MERIERERQELTARLRRVSTAGRVAFAAACSERLLRGVEAAGAEGDTQARRILDLLWQSAADYRFVDRKQDLRDLLEEVEDGISDEFELPAGTEAAEEVAQFASDAVVETLACSVSHEPHMAANAAAAVWNALVAYATREDDVDSGTSAFEQAFYDSTLMRTELAAEEADLAFVAAHPDLNDDQAAEIRRRARQNPLALFGL